MSLADATNKDAAKHLHVIFPLVLTLSSFKFQLNHY